MFPGKTGEWVVNQVGKTCPQYGWTPAHLLGSGCDRLRWNKKWKREKCLVLLSGAGHVLPAAALELYVLQPLNSGTCTGGCSGLLGLQPWTQGCTLGSLALRLWLFPALQFADIHQKLSSLCDFQKGEPVS